MNESSLSRIWTHIQDYDCAIISANRNVMVNCCCDDVAGREMESVVSNQENAEATHVLKALLLNQGYGVTGVIGSYIENYNTLAAKEVKESSFFVANLEGASGFVDDIADLGQKFCQDSVIIIPQGGEESYLLGTNKTVYPGLGKKIDLGAFIGGKEAAFMTRVGGRPFVLESRKNMSRMERMAIWAISRNIRG